MKEDPSRAYASCPTSRIGTWYEAAIWAQRYYRFDAANSYRLEKKMKTLLVVLLSFTFLSCRNDTGGTDSSSATASTMTGNWKGTSTTPNIDLTMTLAQRNDKSITGSGYIWTSSVTVAGTNDFPDVSLDIAASFQNAVFSGRFQSPNIVTGTFNFQGTTVSNFTLIRQ